MDAYNTVGWLGTVVAAMGVASASPIATSRAMGLKSTPSVERAETSNKSAVDSKTMELVVSELRRLLSVQMDLPQQQYEVSFESASVVPSIPLNATQVEVLGFGSDGSKRLDGLVSLQLVSRHAGVSMEHRLSGVMRVIGPVWTNRGNLARGQVLRAEDIEVIRQSWKNLPSHAMGVSAAQLVGRRIKMSLSARSVLGADFLEMPVAVRSGELVDVTVLSGPGVIVRSKAVAKQEGRVGDAVRLEQTETRKSIVGYVVGPRSVELRL